MALSLERWKKDQATYHRIYKGLVSSGATLEDATLAAKTEVSRLRKNRRDGTNPGRKVKTSL